MASKRDELQAYRFLVQRVTSAVVRGETDPEHPPFRRPAGAGFGSIALAVVALAVAGVYGYVKPGGNQAWRDGESVIVEKETGTRYVYLDGRLHPVLNYASALLALGKHGDTKTVSGNSLAGVPRGPRIGISDAPDALPVKDKLLTGGWTLCSRRAADPTGSAVDESTLLVGAEPAGGSPLEDKALLVEVADTGDQFLIWHGFRHRVRQPDTVTVGLALRSEPRARVGMAVVDVLPAGEAIAPITVPGTGAPSTAVPARPDIRVGQLLVAQTSGGAQHFLADADRLRPISELQYDIQLAFKPTAAAYNGGEPVGIPLGLLAIAEARQDTVPVPVAGASPATRPEFAGASGDPVAVCATFDVGASAPRLRLDPVLPPADRLSATGQHSSRGTPFADHVIVEPGRAALVEVMPSAEAPAGALAVVTDQGRAFSLGGKEVVGILGYGDVTPARIPAVLMARVPQGSGLNHLAALARGDA